MYSSGRRSEYVKVLYSYVGTRQLSAKQREERLGLRLLNALTSFGGQIAGKG